MTVVQTPTALQAFTGRQVRTYVPPVQLEFRDLRAASGSRYLEGRAVPYDTWEDVGWYMESMAPGVFARSIEAAANALPLLLWHNSRSFPVGVSERWTEADDALLGVWKMDSHEDAQRAVQQAEDGMQIGLSVGFAPVQGGTRILSETEVKARGLEWDGWTDWVVREEARLLETSLTPTPAYADAQVTLVRSRGGAAGRQAPAAHRRQSLDEWKRIREELRRP